MKSRFHSCRALGDGGVQNRFGESGAPAELIEHFGMGVSHIIAAAKKAVKRK